MCLGGEGLHWFFVDTTELHMDGLYDVVDKMREVPFRLFALMRMSMISAISPVQGFR